MSQKDKSLLNLNDKKTLCFEKIPLKTSNKINPSIEKFTANISQIKVQISKLLNKNYQEQKIVTNESLTIPKKKIIRNFNSVQFDLLKQNSGNISSRNILRRKVSLVSDETEPKTQREFNHKSQFQNYFKQESSCKKQKMNTEKPSKNEESKTKISPINHIQRLNKINFKNKEIPSFSNIRSENSLNDNLEFQNKITNKNSRNKKISNLMLRNNTNSSFNDQNLLIENSKRNSSHSGIFIDTNNLKNRISAIGASNHKVQDDILLMSDRFSKTNRYHEAFVDIYNIVSGDKFDFEKGAYVFNNEMTNYNILKESKVNIFTQTAKISRIAESVAFNSRNMLYEKFQLAQNNSSSSVSMKFKFKIKKKNNLNWIRLDQNLAQASSIFRRLKREQKEAINKIKELK